jgi:hypothetical protein
MLRRYDVFRVAPKWRRSDSVGLCLPKLAEFRDTPDMNMISGALNITLRRQAEMERVNRVTGHRVTGSAIFSWSGRVTGQSRK